MEKQIGSMYKTELETTFWVFRTAYKIGKYGRLYTDLALDVSLQQLNGLSLGRVLHSNVHRHN